MEKHWSKTQLLHEVVTNPNIIVKGTHSYYSDCWDSGFESYCVRYLQGDAISRAWNNNWELDKLHIGDYVCIAAEVIILMGGNHTHRADWFCLYPFADFIDEAYERKGDTIIEDGAWLGMRSILLPGVKIGEGAIIAANSVVTKNVEPYSIVAGSPAKLVKHRFTSEVINDLLALKIYDWPEDKFNAVKRQLCANDMHALKEAVAIYDQGLSST
ncbi:CatB-related O-acetyltransferase [Bartonella sp. HY761]|uniref:CatB-related O-acetyltransferase n=1 Tax=Bartonella sp. HY761 TaxID=2979330 RepID=UPI0021F940CE|nr:CatB-related O-acetyltransferase [Bartonella sp. HY761]UXN05891.1 CatB-related O-acetyltransferase [Bartonella sp. HY761]